MCRMPFFLCRDTFWIESFNDQLVSYVPKQIHFGSRTFKMRLNLACMDRISAVYFDSKLFLTKIITEII